MKRAWFLLLLAPFVGTLFPAFYNRLEPALFGLPFFYWYQLLWIVLTSLILSLVLLMTKEKRDV